MDKELRAWLRQTARNALGGSGQDNRGSDEYKNADKSTRRSMVDAVVDVLAPLTTDSRCPLCSATFRDPVELVDHFGREHDESRRGGNHGGNQKKKDSCTLN